MQLHQQNLVFAYEPLEVIDDHFKLCRSYCRNVEVMLPKQREETLLLAGEDEPHADYVARTTVIAFAFSAKALADVELSIFD